MLETFTAATFQPLLGQEFVVHSPEGATMALRLDEAAEWGSPGSGSNGRTPFSLLFRNPSGQLWTQRSYRVSHDTIGEFPLFVVPLGPDERGMRYEAVFV